MNRIGLTPHKAGVFLTSVIKSNVSESGNGITESFEKNITSIATAVVKAKIIDEKQAFINGTLEITVQVEAQVDIDAAHNLFRASQSDPEISNQLELQQIQLQDLEKKLSNLQKQLSVSKDEEAFAKRVERKKTLNEISKVQNIQINIESATKRAVEKVLIGMTYLEVIQVAGEPRSSDDLFGAYNYGSVWVILESGIVKCLVKSSEYQQGSACRHYDPYQIVKK
jgi:hypothetical protein